MKTVSRMVTKLRPYWMVLMRDFRAAFTQCQRCKAFGSYPCSICACISLCDTCTREESIKLDKRLHEIAQ